MNHRSTWWEKRQEPRCILREDHRYHRCTVPPEDQRLCHRRQSALVWTLISSKLWLLNKTTQWNLSNEGGIGTVERPVALPEWVLLSNSSINKRLTPLQRPPREEDDSGGSCPTFISRPSTHVHYIWRWSRSNIDKNFGGCPIQA